MDAPGMVTVVKMVTIAIAVVVSVRVRPSVNRMLLLEG